MRTDSLRIRLEQALQNKYPNYLTLDEVEDICKEFKKKIVNADRRFRNDNKPGASKVTAEKIYNDKRTAIIGYKWIPSVEKPARYRSPKEVITDALDDELKGILARIPISWENQAKIKELNSALKSSYNETKEAVIKKYT